ncbi:hypothetical protein SAMN04487917_102551 [Arthrobacter sp. yr096]|uniref:hypothetical protein n=1 Tax=Arthrobacter sp. yr096 TaxID=1761750 RepID=UPI0008AFB642|nr:hypothetical protein [Arthrobacter sp. yr096]SEI82811.1 hypothetical protein SAMN04487917_102551 [Arthrobacter sp. yr096]
MVIAQTVALPVVAAVLEMTVIGGDPVLVFGKWWVFWGVGSRLLVACVAQLAGKGLTAAIVGAAIPTAQETQLTRELGMANVSMGLAGLLALVPGWALPAGFSGRGVPLHRGNHARAEKEQGQGSTGNRTPLVVGAAVVSLAAYVLFRAAAG